MRNLNAWTCTLALLISVCLSAQDISACNVVAKGSLLPRSESDRWGDVVNVKDYNVIPGKRDWTGCRTYGAEIQAIVDSNPNKRIFPAGTYRTSSPIRISNGAQIIGEGKNVTVIQPMKCDGFIVSCDSVKISDLSIVAHNKKASPDFPDSPENDVSGLSGIVLGAGGATDNNKSITYISLENISIDRFSVGIYCVNVWSSKFSLVDILDDNPKPGSQIDHFVIDRGIEFHGQCVNNQISNCSITAESAGVSIVKDGLSSSEGLMIQNTLLYGAKCNIYSSGILGLHIANCVIDNASAWGICVSDTSAMTITNSWIATVGTEGIHMERCFDCAIANNVIKCIGTNTIRGISVVDGCHENIIQGNTVEINNVTANSIYLGEDTRNNLIVNNMLTSRGENSKLLGSSRITDASIVDPNEQPVKASANSVQFNLML